MKSKIVGILVTGMIMVSLAGCGTKTGATEQVPESSDAVVDVSNEITETEDTEADVEGKEEKITENEFVGAEDENIVLYAEVGSQDYCPLDEKNYESSTDTVSAMEDIPLYNSGGYAVGYIKNGSSITLDETGTDIGWARFENPIAGTDYDYLYVLKDYITVPDVNQFTVTESDIKQKIIDDIKNLDVTDYIFVDTPSNDMEVFEFRIESVFKDEIDFNYWYSQCTEDGNIALSSYMTYCIECEKDTDGWILCKVYYKDEIPEEVWNQHYYKY